MLFVQDFERAQQPLDLSLLLLEALDIRQVYEPPQAAGQCFDRPIHSEIGAEQFLEDGDARAVAQLGDHDLGYTVRNHESCSSALFSMTSPARKIVSPLAIMSAPSAMFSNTVGSMVPIIVGFPR